MWPESLLPHGGPASCAVWDPSSGRTKTEGKAPFSLSLFHQCEVVIRHLCMVDSCHFMCGHLAQFHIPPPTGWALHMLASEAICIARRGAFDCARPAKRAASFETSGTLCALSTEFWILHQLFKHCITYIQHITYIHTYLQTLHTYINTYIHTCLHTNKQPLHTLYTYTHACVHT